MNYIQLLLNQQRNIKNKYRKLEKTQIKVIKNKWLLLFNNTCLTEDILPNYSKNTFKNNNNNKVS